MVCVSLGLCSLKSDFPVRVEAKAKMDAKPGTPNGYAPMLPPICKGCKTMHTTGADARGCLKCPNRCHRCEGELDGMDKPCFGHHGCEVC